MYFDVREGHWGKSVISPKPHEELKTKLRKKLILLLMNPTIVFE
jgi:hypothetical protein